MGKLALRVGARALLTLELAADLQLEPARVLLVEKGADVEHGDGAGRAHVGRVGHDRGGAHGAAHKPVLGAERERERQKEQPLPVVSVSLSYLTGGSGSQER